MASPKEKSAAHRNRWLTAVVAVPVLVVIIGFGPRWLFHLLLFLAAILGHFEFYRMACPELPWSFQAANGLLTLWLFVFLSMGQVFILPAIVLFWVMVPMALSMFRFRPGEARPVDFLGKVIFAPLYTCLPLALLIVVDRFPRGNLWIFYLLVVIFSGDTGAFYVGRSIGKHKLYPSVSPGKTWEGAFGGLLASLGVGLLFSQFFHLHRWGLPMVLITACLSISSQIGDLSESMIKRTYGVKDSGGILPGHGGILDRIDGLLFSIPVLYIFLSWTI